MLIKVDLEVGEIKRTGCCGRVIETKLEDVVGKLFSRTLWHPSARMQMMQFLFHRYGIDEVAAIKAKREAIQAL